VPLLKLKLEPLKWGIPYAGVQAAYIIEAFVANAVRHRASTVFGSSIVVGQTPVLMRKRANSQSAVPTLYLPASQLRTRFEPGKTAVV